MVQQVEYLITGVTGGLGRCILDILLSAQVPASSIAVSSTRASTAPTYEARGLLFRTLSFDDPAALLRAFAGVRNLFFVSTNTFDNEKRTRQHRNVVEAAEKARVGHVFYSSLGIGGSEDAWDVPLMVAHLETERMLRESSLTWTVVRESVYTDAFPVFLTWYPTDPNQVLYLPCDGHIAFATRDELGEATAKLMMKGGYENQIVLLTGPRAVPLSSLVSIINSTTNRNITIKFVSDDEYVALNTANNEGGKPESFFRDWVSLLSGFGKGKAATVSPLMGNLLGRPPKDAEDAVREMLERNRNYTWHQNYASTG